MNERAEFEQLLKSLLGAIEKTFASGQKLSDQIQGQLAQTLSSLINKIDKLSFENQTIVNESSGQPNIPAGTDLLWILSGGDINSFVNYLRTYPGQGLNQLALNPTQLQQTINYLQSNYVIGIPGESQGIPNTQLQSSNVAGMKYDPQTQRLLVRFHGNTHEPVYEYLNVPPMIYEILEHGNAFAKTKGKNRWGEWWENKNPSLGAAINQYLKAGNFPYQKIS